ncbi:MAG: pyrimidine-nucleoside phosphorylase [Chitinophagales bacterium]
MNTEQIIRKKRDGYELSTEEIDLFIKGMVSGKIADYQVAAWAMAIYFRGMNEREVNDLALAMAGSGEVVDLSFIDGIKVDKHSTGGVGDKTTMIVVPIVAAAGVAVAKMSGRSLGYTGGTIDKFEAIPGFRTGLKRREFIDQINQIKAAVVAQTGNLVPADKKLYAIRDVTATIESIPLIASSVMSKKIASGADAVVLDVKVGKGAFMKEIENARILARQMVATGVKAGRKMVAIISRMDQPLGYSIGNALEVKEAVATLQGKGAPDLEELCLVLASHMVILGGAAQTLEEARDKVTEILDSGKGYEKLCQLVEMQGGEVAALNNMHLVHPASLQVVVKSPGAGYLTGVECEEIGRIAMMLGAGREKYEDRIDYSVGLTLQKKTGDYVQKDEPLAIIYANDPYKMQIARDRIIRACTLSEQPPVLEPLIMETVIG